MIDVPSNLDLRLDRLPEVSQFIPLHSHYTCRIQFPKEAMYSQIGMEKVYRHSVALSVHQLAILRRQSCFHIQ
jgi:hypothetical protein